MKTTRITVETETLTVVRRAKLEQGWCPECRAEVDVITIESKSLADPAVAAQIERWLGTGKLHFWHSGEGPAQMCATSLLRCFGGEDAQGTAGGDESS